MGDNNMVNNGDDAKTTPIHILQLQQD